MHKFTSHALAIMYNMCLLRGLTPSAWDMNRTKLLLKEGKDAADPNNYRPITISSIISRTFWGIVDTKLTRLTTLHSSQTGFIPENGCFNNVQTFNNLLTHAKGQKGMVSTLLDVKK